MIGTRLGPYEITAKLGEGGMGEVYRATDTRLERDVAIKVLPAAFTKDPARLSRFEREAKLLAQLHHPHIASIFGLEESEGVSALVMELVEGPTLAERLRGQSPLDLEESLEIAGQIAEALEEAHEKGIIHRDLKPQNVKLTPEGKVKVLDFGLAKATEPASAGAALPPDSSHSPTAAIDQTREGVVLGTAAYMAPEQARGRAVDKRADIWSFGVVLYEMLTGERLFARGSVADTLSAVLGKEVDLTRLPSATPPRLRELVGRCLERDHRNRLRDIGEARLLLQKVLAEGGAEKRSSTSSPTALSGAPSVAVLPLVNLSPDPENEFFADGMTEDIIAHLAKIRSLKVISRTSVMQFKKSDRTLREIGEVLGAATLVEGSVRRAGNRVRIVVQLIDGATDEHLWAETYDRDLTDIFAIQTDVALQVADALRAELSTKERKRVKRHQAVDLEAYDHYLQGRGALRRFNLDGFLRGVQAFERAVALDPGFAKAHAGIAHAHCEMTIQGSAGQSPEESISTARRAVQRALELDGELAEAHGISGLILFTFDFDWRASEQAFLKAIELGPGVAETHNHYSWLLSSLERFDEALHEIRLARELDPLFVQSDVETALLRAGRTEEAMEESRRSIQREPGNPRCHSNLAWALIFEGQTEQGIAELESAVSLSPGSTLFRSQLGQAYAMSGDNKRARAILLDLQERAKSEFVSPYHLAYVHTGLGEADQAIDLLERAVERRSGATYGIKGSFLFRSLRGHPRFEALLRRMNLV